jgi:hypothetical protein
MTNDSQVLIPNEHFLFHEQTMEIWSTQSSLGEISTILKVRTRQLMKVRYVAKAGEFVDG